MNPKPPVNLSKVTRDDAANLGQYGAADMTSDRYAYLDGAPR
jgi:hypothetical protein